MRRWIRRKAKGQETWFSPLFLGALTVFIPCGVTQAMMATALGTGSAAMGAVTELGDIVEGLHQHIPKGYVYFAMGFSIFVEMLNLRLRGKDGRQPVALRTAYAAVNTDSPVIPRGVRSSTKGRNKKR